MCAVCGCAEAAHEHGHGHGHVHGQRVGRLKSLEVDLLARNRRLAEENRRWFLERDLLALNLTSSPGAGKTTLLERTLVDLRGERPCVVIEGDQATELDAERIRATGTRAAQVNTGAGCHLDAGMVARAARELDPPRGGLVFIENVGNLVCPAMFDLGERARVVVASVTEGDDKPAKYPHMFRGADLVLLNKLDLLPHVRFDVGRFRAALSAVGGRAPVLEVSATRGDGLEAWYGWLREARLTSEVTA